MGRSVWRLFVLCAIVSVLLFACAVPAGNDVPKVADWPSDPNAVVVQWYLANADDDGTYERAVEAIFEDARGWQQADVDFVRVANASDARVVIRMYDPDTEQPCVQREGLLVACTRGSVLGFGSCTVHLPSVRVSEVFTIFVNHEVGHCLGFRHIPNVLMRPTFTMDRSGRVTDGPIWPTEDELDRLRRRLRSYNDPA